jgi:hypothetical protein
MGSGCGARDRWSAQLVASVVDATPGPALYAHLDALLHWLAAADAPDSAAIAAELRRRAIDPDTARSQAFRLLDRALFSRPGRDPARVLGLANDWTDSELQARYRLLIRVYHPDTAAGVPERLIERAKRINSAYAEVRRWRRAPPSSPRRRTLRSGSRWRRARHRPLLRDWMRQRLGSPERFQRRFLVALLIGCAIVVSHTCVANRDWRRSDSGARASPLTHPQGTPAWSPAR